MSSCINIMADISDQQYKLLRRHGAGFGPRPVEQSVQDALLLRAGRVRPLSSPAAAPSR